MGSYLRWKRSCYWLWIRWILHSFWITICASFWASNFSVVIYMRWLIHLLMVFADEIDVFFVEGFLHDWHKLFNLIVIKIFIITKQNHPLWPSSTWWGVAFLPDFVNFYPYWELLLFLFFCSIFRLFFCEAHLKDILALLHVDHFF